MPQPSRLIYFVACDWAGSGDAQKNVYAGVYASSILLETFPAILASLTLVLCFRASRRATEDVEMEITFPGQPPQKTPLRLEFQNPLSANTRLIHLSPCHLLQPGKIAIELAFPDGEHISAGLDVLALEAFKQSKWEAT